MESFLIWFLNVVLGDDFDLMLTMFVLVGVAEYLVPAHLSFAFVNVFAVGTIAPLLSLGAAYAIQKVSFGLIDLRALGFSGIGGSLFALFIGTLIWDLLQYWQRRAEHGSQLLWQLHVLHHCDEHMNVTTASRHHILELVLAPVFVTIPTAILFQVPPVTIAILSLIPYAWLYFTHAHINLGFGPFWWFAGEPELPSCPPFADAGAYRPEFRQLVSGLGWHCGRAAMERMSVDRSRRRVGADAGGSLSAAA